MSRGTAIIAVGDEILAGFIADTNSGYLAERTFRAGYPVRRIVVVGDDPAAIGREVRAAVDDVALSRIAVCGGVGPTPDDRTYEGVARGLGVELVEHPDAVGHIDGIVHRMHAAGWIPAPLISAANRRMAVLPAGARVLENRRGMASPTAHAVGDDRWLFVLPGVPREFTVIVDEVLLPEFFTGGDAPHVREARFEGIPEAEFAPAMLQLADEFPDVLVGSYPQSATRDLIIRARGADPERVDATMRRLEELRPRR